MKHRTIQIAFAFGRYSLGAFGTALFLLSLQLGVDAIACMIQSERDD